MSAVTSVTGTTQTREQEEMTPTTQAAQAVAGQTLSTSPVVSTSISAAHAQQQATGLKPWMVEFKKTMPELPEDTYSNAEPKKIVTTHLVWDTEPPNFEARTLEATATYTYNNLAEDNTKLVLDVQHLEIFDVLVNGEKAEYQVRKSTDVKPDALQIAIPAKKGLGEVQIRYKTSEKAEGIFWVDAPFTEGQKHPLVYTLFEPVEGPSVIPGQHCPQVRLTYEVNAKTGSSEMMALSSVKNNPVVRREDGYYKGMRMDRAVPLYLLSYHVGNISYRDYGDGKTGVFAEDAMIGRTEKEMSKLPEFMRAAEKICGPYNWEKYCPIILCWAFPYGAMEHPCASTCGSIVLEQPSIIPHELAHSWTGNDTTNCNWYQYFWNEGWTTFVEYLITEEIWGSDYAAMRFIFILNEAKGAIEEYRETKPEALKLCNQSQEFVFTRIPYAKGALMFFTLREAMGHEAFDRFLKDYMVVFCQNTMSDGRFLEFLRLWLKNEKGMEDFEAFRKETQLDKWLYEVEIPDNAPTFRSRLLDEMDEEIGKIVSGQKPDVEKITAWDATTQLTFLNRCGGKITKEHLAPLDAYFDYSQSEYMSLLGEWSRLCATFAYFTKNTRDMIVHYVIKRNSGHEATKIVTALCKTEEGRQLAQRIVKEGEGKLFPFTMDKVKKALT